MPWRSRCVDRWDRVGRETVPGILHRASRSRAETRQATLADFEWWTSNHGELVYLR